MGETAGSGLQLGNRQSGMETKRMNLPANLVDSNRANPCFGRFPNDPEGERANLPARGLRA